MTPDLIERLRSVVGVKPLVWSDNAAPSVLGLYRIVDVTDFLSDARFNVWLDSSNSDEAEGVYVTGNLDSWNAASAAAQAHLETQLFSALIPVEPVPTPREAELEAAATLARQNFHTMQNAANKLRIRAETAETALREIIAQDDAFRSSLSPIAEKDPVTLACDRARLALNPTHGKEPAE